MNGIEITQAVLKQILNRSEFSAFTLDYIMDFRGVEANNKTLFDNMSEYELLQ